VRWFAERQEARSKELLSTGDIGILDLEIQFFDWDPTTLRPIYVRTPRLDWQLFDPASDDELAPGTQQLVLDRTETAVANPLARGWRVQARGGKAILVVNRTDCAPSVVPVARLPGYAQREHPPHLRIVVPTCEATRASMIDVEAGPYISGGEGDPPIQGFEGLTTAEMPPERTLDLPAFAIDRTEVSNAAYAMVASPAYSTAIPMPVYPSNDTYRHAGEPAYPVGRVTWSQAQAYCRFLGKTLPSDAQWEKAMRGGLRVHGAPNPMPRRIVPWGTPMAARGNVKTASGGQPAPTGAFAGDVSPYGVLDLGGNLQEWTRTPLDRDFYSARGCSWEVCTNAMLPMVAVPNARAATFTVFDLGFRCVIE
jgi:formylglycine-generating enzyme required for sulfatase activity